MQNPFDFEPEQGGIWRVLKVAIAFILFVWLVSLLLNPARAMNIRALKLEPEAGPPWQIVERHVCVGPLAVYIVVGQVFAKAGMSGAISLKVLPPSEGLATREYGRQGAAFQFQTRWRRNMCLHSFRSIYQVRGEERGE